MSNKSNLKWDENKEVLELTSKNTSLELYHFKQNLRTLERKKSFNQSTNLVTIYVPPGTQLSDISSKLRDEMGTATNIKDKKTGKAVADALKTVLARMPLLKNGDNGIAIFCGITEDAQKVEYFAIDPPEPINIKNYVCDTHFHVDHLKEMLESKNQLGIIVIDRGGATFAAIRGSSLKIIDDQESFVPGKHSRGGQSAGRIERGIEILAREFYSKMARKANQIFLGEYPVSALVIGGPAMSKDEFIEHPTLDYRLREKILQVYDVGYTGEAGVRELLVRAEDDLQEFALVREKKLVQQFLMEIANDSGKITYGENNVRKALELSAADLVLFSEEIERITAYISCSSCGKDFKETKKPIDMEEIRLKVIQTVCPSCKSSSTLEIVEEKFLLDEFEGMALETGAQIEVISTLHEDGSIFYNSFTGIGAILRYPMDW